MVNAIWSFGWFTVAVFLTKIMRYFWVWVIIIFYPLRGVFRRNRQTFDLHVPCIVCGATFFELAVIVLVLQLSLVFVANPQSIPVMMDWLRGLLIEKAKTFSRIVCLLSIKKLWDMDFKYVDFKRGISLSKYLKSAENCSMASSQPSWSNMPKHLSVTLLKLSRATVSFRHFADTLASISMLSNLSMLFSSFLTWFPSNFPPASHFDGCSLHLTNQRQWCCSQEVFVAFYWDSQKCG